MDFMTATLQELAELRSQRLQLMDERYADDPNEFKHMLVDAINMLEALFVIVSLPPPPPDGWVSLTPERTDDSE